MKDKIYVVITNANRERMRYYIPPYSSEVTKETYPYRKGDLGLIERRLIEFYANLDDNMKRYTGRYENGKLTSYEYPRSLGEGDFFPVYDKKIIPVLLYKGNLVLGGYSGGKELEYFITGLKKKEFTKIQGITLGEVKKGVKDIYEEHGINYMRLDKPLDETIEEQYRNLEAFNILFSNKMICKIPIETTKRKISEKEIDLQREYPEKMRKYDILEATSRADAHKVFIP